MTFEELKKFIEANRGESIEFGTSEDSPSDAWIEKAEDSLGAKFPPSYIWYLKNYGGGEIHGDEIFSIYEIPFDEVVGGDIVYQTTLDRKNGFIDQNEILICSTDFGEQFVMDTSYQDENGEYPIIRKTGEKRESFSLSFSGFIVKFVGDSSLI